MALFQLPGEEDFEVLLAENAFVSDVQLAIESALAEAHMTQASLARHLGISEARVSQMLSGNGKNLQARTIARVAHALGLRVLIDLVAEDSGWITFETDDSAEAHPFSDDFSEWIAGAYQLDSIDVNDNWSAPEAVPSDGERLVAA